MMHSFPIVGKRKNDTRQTKYLTFDGKYITRESMETKTHERKEVWFTPNDAISLKIVLLKRGINQTGWAESHGINPADMSRTINGQRAVSARIREALIADFPEWAAEQGLS